MKLIEPEEYEELAQRDRFAYRLVPARLWRCWRETGKTMQLDSRIVASELRQAGFLVQFSHLRWNDM